MPASATINVRRSQFRLTRVAVGAAGLVVTFAGLLRYESHIRAEELRLAEVIREAGGRVDLRAPLRQRMILLLHRAPVHGTAVFLGRGIDDAWIRRHEHLRGLRVESLTIGGVDLSGAGLAELLAEHPIKVLRANGEDLTDESIAALGGNGNLKELSIAYTSLNDAQFLRLPLEQLHRLDISGTRVTAAGLRPINRCSNLRRLDLDGAQLTTETVSSLKELPMLEQLTLCGPEVADDDMQLLHNLTNLEAVRLWSTSVTKTGKENLQQVLRGCTVGEW